MVKGLVENTLHDLGEHELDGGGVFEEGDTVVTFDSGKGGSAIVFVRVTIVVAGHGFGAALVAGGFDVAAAAGFVDGLGWGGCVEVAVS